VAVVVAATWLDGAVLGAVAAFAAWGVAAGVVRQASGLVVLVLAFGVAAVATPRLVGPASRLLGPSDASAAPCLAWGMAFAATLVVGAFVLHAIHGVLARLPKAGVVDRVAGGAVGAVKGVLILGLVAYVALGAAKPASASADLARRSVSGRVLRGLEARLRPWAMLPAGVQARVDEVNDALRAPAP
jgi:uncharacterized membrane protein required for colicin V production